MLYYILYHRQPNQGRHVTEMLLASQEKKARGQLRHGILFRGQRTPKNVRESIDALEQICLKALEPALENRYANVEDLIIDLNEWLKQTPL